MTSSEAREGEIQAVLERRRRDINEEIATELPIDEPERLYEASRYLLDAGGKRLRPALLLLVAEALADVSPGTASYRSFPSLDGETVDVMRAALSIEVIQSFTLIHDDIMDDDELRRGVPAVHEAFDLETAILAGDTLYSKAFEIMLETGAPAERGIQALHALARTCTQICEGQSFDIAYERRADVTIPEYRRMVKLKTAVLFRAAASVPAILLGADQETVDALGRYGLAVGEAFQIHDDVLDLTVPSDTLGKDRGSDLIEGKRTLITLHAQQQGVDVDEIRPTTEAEIDAAVNRLQEAGSIRYARERARSLIEDGREELAVLPDTEARDLLDDLAVFLVERGY